MSRDILKNNPIIQELVECIKKTDVVIGSSPEVDYVIITNLQSKMMFTFTKNKEGYQLTWREKAQDE